MKKKVKTALVLAGGYGTRLLPNTRAYPKELITFGEKPIIEYVIETIRDCGLRNLAIVVGWKKGGLMDYLGNGRHWGVDIVYLQQESVKGLGNAILMGDSFFSHSDEEDFIVFFGDNFIRPSKNLSTLIEIHETHQPLATVLVFKTKVPEKYGVVRLEKEGNYERVVDMFEKPETIGEKRAFESDGDYYAIPRQAREYYAISCAYVFNKRIFSYIKQTKPGKKGEIQITDAVKLGLENGEKIYAHVLDGDFFDVGSWNYLRKVHSYFCSLSKDDLERIIDERKQLMRKLIDKD